MPQASFDQLEAEVVAARGNRSDLNRRISAISNFASPNAGGVIAGEYYDNAFHGTANATRAGVANEINLAPYYTSQPLRIDEIGVSVSTAVNGSELKLVIYGSTDEGWPDELLFESLPLSSATVGYKFEGLDFTFDSGRQYWLGVRHSSTATLRALNLSSAVNLGCNGSNAANYFTVLRRTVAFADPAPNPWDFSANQRIANWAPNSVRMRAAALP
ncbi:hypothetical protein KBY96_07700 [Cyanobium sp. ATX 6A2]|uniref:hypothetical protein n=1 Tax=Cyanobium sp. ATX 6A2 TaxID=2823700 RepID=UPI0020CBA19D|nr:hypothetical protein [Cyanobium sp. ATX 6A2]MCP9887814.1 hypothetical protein [Cyanobium sp. ATX 6A2]